MPRKDKGIGDRVNNIIQVFDYVKDHDEAVTASPEPKRRRKVKTSTPALDKVDGKQQELIAKALLAVDAGLDKILQILIGPKPDKNGNVPPTPALKFTNGPMTIQALARLAQAQADIAQLVNAKSNLFKDSEALEERLLEALERMPG
jgi:hypothetical protein